MKNLPFVFVAALAATACGSSNTVTLPPPPVVQTPPPAASMSFTRPLTDNYKAGFNSNPAIRELRTWFRISAATAGGRTWLPATTTRFQAAGSLSPFPVQAADGTQGSMSAEIVSGPVKSLFFRNDASDNWGVLAQVTSVTDLSAAPMVISLTVRNSAGVVQGSTNVKYLYDAALAAAPPSDLEYNGPSGRWYQNGLPTPTNVEAGVR